jgi:amino acid transporter
MLKKTELHRIVGTPLLVLYGVGTIVGAGIYALLGEVAARAGYWAPASFVVAAAMAAATALSFAELSSRFPKSAGEAEYVAVAFSSKLLSTIVGLLVILIGSISAATVANGFAGYATDLVPLSRELLITAFVLAVGLIAAWGIRQSLLIAAVITIVEIGGLLLVIGFATATLTSGVNTPPIESSAISNLQLTGVLSGAILAFYAYVGFEDMVNVAEEVRDAQHALPRAIVITLVATTLLYLVLSIVAVRVVSPEELAGTGAPLRLVYERAGGPQPRILNAIGVLAMVNGALVQIIMAARVAYGLSDRGALPGWLGSVNRITRTPLLATCAISLFVAIMALRFPIATLAQATSLITLSVFATVNSALVVVKKRVDLPPAEFEVPAALPWGGLVVSVGALLYALYAGL